VTASDPVVRVRDLRTTFQSIGAPARALGGVDLESERGEFRPGDGPVRMHGVHDGEVVIAGGGLRRAPSAVPIVLQLVNLAAAAPARTPPAVARQAE